MEQNFWQLISNKKQWEQSLLTNSRANFLQSYNFGEFHEKLGNQVWRFGKTQNGLVVSFAQTILLRTKFSKFFYVPWGPILSDAEDLKSLVEEIKNLGIREKVNFIRFDPRIVNGEELAIYQKLGLKKANNFTQPEATLILDLTKNIEELRKNLSESTRYNIGWVERKGVRVEVSQSPESDIEIFLELLEETAFRQGFNLYNEKNYYREQFLNFSKENSAKLFLAKEPQEIEGKTLAAAIVIYYGDRVTYLHAASSSKNPKLRAPYLMQWKIIEDAKNNGFKNYDFWGVAKNEDPKDPWAGVTAFKRSFGGERISYQVPFDLVLRNGYYLDIIVERFRKPLKRIITR